MHHILLLRFSAIGDLLLTTPLLRAIRTKYPTANITMVVREDLAETLRHNPRLSHLITWKRGTPLAPLVKQLKQTDWTHQLDLHGSLRTLQIRKMLGGNWGSYSKHRIRRALLIRSKGKLGGNLGHVVERYFEAARDLEVVPDGGSLEFFTTQEAEQSVANFLQQHRLGVKRNLIALAPGAAHFTKRWPVEHWEALARRLRAKSDIVVLGGPAEKEIATVIAAAGGDAAASAAGPFSLTETAALLKRSRALVSGDTGVMHLATAVKTPAVAMYGPTIEAFGFFPYHAKAVVLQRELYCRPCSAHGGPKCPEGHHRCMTEITPEDVTNALEKLPR